MAYDVAEDDRPMLSQDLIRALADDRERAVADHLRQRLAKREPSIRWVRRPMKPIDRR
jgi:hypothetical protein